MHGTSEEKKKKQRPRSMTVGQSAGRNHFGAVPSGSVRGAPGSMSSAPRLPLATLVANLGASQSMNSLVSPRGDQGAPPKVPVSPRTRGVSALVSPRGIGARGVWVDRQRLPAVLEGAQVPQFAGAIMPQTVVKTVDEDDNQGEADFEIQVLDAEGRSCSLHIAACHDDFNQIPQLLKTGLVNVNKIDSDGATPLHHAAYRGHVKSGKVLLDNGANVNAEDSDGVTPLMHAAFTGKSEFLHLLLSKGANPNHEDKEGGTALQNASYNGHVAVVKMLIGARAKVDHLDADKSTSMHYAAFGGNIEVMQELMRGGADPAAKDSDGATPLHHAAYCGFTAMCKFLVENGLKPSVKDFGGATPLHSAAYNNKKDTVAYFLSLKGVDINARDASGATALHKSAYMGDEAVMHLLLDKGADIAAQDSEGSTPIHMAAYNGRASCVKILLERGADPNSQDNDQGTPLHNSIYNGHAECAQLLIKGIPGSRKAKVDAKDKDGRTALHHAACFGLRDCAQVLLDSLADPNMPDNDKFTPLHLTAFNGSSATAAFLLDKGANTRAKSSEGVYPVHYAAFRNHMGMLLLLTERKSPLSPTDDRGVTPLHNAVLGGSGDTAHYLLYKGAEVNAQDDDGETPLHYAVRQNNVELCALLVSKRADWKAIYNVEKLSPLDLALKLNNEGVRGFFAILEAEGKNAFSPENKAKWMSMQRDDFKTNLRALEEQMKIFNIKAGHGAEAHTNSSAAEKNFCKKTGIEMDPNDHHSIVEQAKFETRRLKSSHTFLNVLRHFVLVPQHFDVGHKTWQLIELFIHGVTMLRDEEFVGEDPTKLSASEFVKALKQRDKIDSEEKLRQLRSIEQALKILFPNQVYVDDDACEIDFPALDEDSDIDLQGASSDIETDDDQPKPRMRTNRKTGQTEVERDVDEEFDIGSGPAPALPDIPDEIDGGSGIEKSGEADRDDPVMPPGGGPPPPPGAPPPMPPPLGLGAKFVFDGIKLKRFNWTKVPQDKLRKSMWPQAERNTKGIVLDEKTLEAVFYLRTGKEVETEKKDKSINVLDLQRANNVGILLAKFDYTDEEVRDAILKCNTKILTLDTARSLIRLTPTSDEIELLKGFKGDPSKLGPPEKFFMKIMDIPRLKERLETIVFLREFESIVEEVLKDMRECGLAMHELRNGLKLRRIMEVVLVLGNFMNRGYGFAAQAQGYTLDSLAKLADTKSTVKVKGRANFTLLHHLVQYLGALKPELLEWPAEMPHLRSGHLEFMNDVSARVSALSQRMAAARDELTRHDPADPFCLLIGKFDAKATVKVKELVDECDQMKKRFENLASYLGEDPAKADPVSTAFKFAQTFKEAIAENKRVEEAKRAAAKKAAANAKMKKRIFGVSVKGKKRRRGSEKRQQDCKRGPQ
eukprot:TRINITY_DN9923_c0_g1_i1.p1 TRINITY_DN9923_c0_g1~~TRINITY_DN9923_c0_g1_i1.p1  ORF type:complete len:1396 (+),score=301.51 TRINITY_DN9923_c0_g1_i1:241-4428(+)